jgi:hypothetical protein
MRALYVEGLATHDGGSHDRPSGWWPAGRLGTLRWYAWDERAWEVRQPVVPAKPLNKTSVAEVVEGRGLARGTHPAGMFL